jgi:hypothetical protein
MESNMVNDVYIKQIENFFLTYFTEFNMVVKCNTMPYGPFFSISYRKEDLTIKISGERGLNIAIIIDGKEYGLWQFDKSVNDHTTINISNLAYQLNVLKEFLL